MASVTAFKDVHSELRTPMGNNVGFQLMQRLLHLQVLLHCAEMWEKKSVSVAVHKTTVDLFCTLVSRISCTSPVCLHPLCQHETLQISGLVELFFPFLQHLFSQSVSNTLFSFFFTRKHLLLKESVLWLVGWISVLWLVNCLSMFQKCLPHNSTRPWPHFFFAYDLGWKYLNE